MFPTDEQLAGPPLPTYFLLPATLLFAALTLLVVLRTSGVAARYLIFVCWFRYTLSSLHPFTYREAFGGFKWIALGSILSIVLGFLVLDKRRILIWPFFPVALICGLMVVSALLNGTPTESIEPILRLIFFVIVAVALWQALESSGPVVMTRLLVVFAAPLVFQLASIVFGVPKSGELDGSLSYIGGYYHEELFSLILVTCFVVAVLAPDLRRNARIFLSVVSFVGVYLANYRTTMLAIAPLALVQLALGMPRGVKLQQRPLVLGLLGIAGAATVVVGLSAAENRFSDFSVLASEGTGLIKPPEQYDWQEQQVLSSRPFMWSQYLYAYADTASPTQRIIGFGPDSWVGKFPNYAHNTAVSFLYELGLLGVAALFLMWATMLRLAFLAPPDSRAVLVTTHLMFFLLNMGTMPHWEVEGNILYGIICGYTLAKARYAARAPARRGWDRIRRVPYASSPLHVRSGPLSR